MAKVKNIKGTSDNNCKCGTWTSHWKRYSGQDLPQFCVASGCIETDLVGAHVQKIGIDDTWFIVMLCNACNKLSGEFEIKDFHKFVPANKALTCEKK